MKKTHPSHYLMHLQLIMIVVLGIITMITHIGLLLNILPGVLSVLAVVMWAVLLSVLGRFLDYVYGSELPSRIYYPQV
jgi:uncharacterized membrane protein